MNEGKTRETGETRKVPEDAEDGKMPEDVKDAEDLEDTIHYVEGRALPRPRKTIESS